MTYVRKNLIYLINFIIIFFSISHYALPLYFDFFLSLLILSFIKEKLLILIISITLIISAFLFSLAWNDKDEHKIFYRPHEKYAINESYKKNVSSTFSMPYGDLYALGDSKKNPRLENIKESRKVNFVTDNYGFRNSKIIKKPDYIFLGDSFIAGNGISQEELPTVIFQNLTKKNILNLGFPGKPKLYEKNMLKHIDLLNKNTKIIVFYFEGNDFETIIEDSISKNISLKEIPKKIYDVYKFAESLKDVYLNKFYKSDEVFFRIIRHKSLSINLEIKDYFKSIFDKNNKVQNELKNKEKVIIKDILNQDVGFLNEYVKNSKEKNIKTYIFKNKLLLEKIDAVVLIPTKYSVYSELLNEKVNNFALTVLKNGYEIHNIPVYDLTTTLRKKARLLLESNEYVFFRDDTHWNANGIKTSMEYLANNIN